MFCDADDVLSLVERDTVLVGAPLELELATVVEDLAVELDGGCVEPSVLVETGSVDRDADPDRSPAAVGLVDACIELSCKAG